MTRRNQIGFEFRPTEIPADLVYHYTSLSGLVGISSSCSLWATDSQYLNDRSEILHFISLVEGSANRYLASAPDCSIAQQFLDWSKHRRLERPYVFVCSFSANGNLLSQWRGYCPKGIGVSLGFSRSALMVCAEQQGFTLVQCIYDIKDQQELADKWFRQVLANAVEHSASHPTQSYHKSFDDLELSLYQAALSCKSSAFQEENEWRLVSAVQQNFVDPPIKYRNTDVLLKPYFEFSLPKDLVGGIRLEHVYVGPNPEGNLAFNSISTFLSKNMPSRCGVSASQIPFRQLA